MNQDREQFTSARRDMQGILAQECQTGNILFAGCRGWVALHER